MRLRSRAGTLVPRLAGAVLVALLLAACSSSEAPPPRPPACPTALVLDGAERTASYRPGGDRSPSALRYQALLTNLTSSCRFAEQGVEVDIGLELRAERGPAGAGELVQLTYFVATIGPNQEILAKPLFDSEIVFAEGEDLAGVAERLTLRLPPLTPEQASAYGLYLGFQLDDAELEERVQPLFR